MALTSKEIYDLNNSMTAAQNISLGDIISNLGSMANQSASSVNITGGSIVAQYGHFGNSGGFTYFDVDGTMIMAGSATVFEDLVVPLTTAKQGQTDKPAFNSTDVGYIFPAGDTTHEMFMIVQMPHAWKLGSRVYPHVHYQHALSGSPVFKIEYKWTSIGEVSTGSFTTFAMSERAIPWSGSPIHQLVTNSSGISGSGKGLSSILQLKLYRDDSAYSGSLLAYQFDIHYERDALGSRTELSK